MDWYFIFAVFSFTFSMFYLCPSAVFIGLWNDYGDFAVQKEKKDFLRKHESLLHEFVWLNLSSFKDVMAGCIANLCWRNCFIIPEPWLETFDLFFPLFCPLNQHADNTVAAASASAVKNDAKQPRRSRFIIFLLFSFWFLAALSFGLCNVQK